MSDHYFMLIADDSIRIDDIIPGVDADDRPRWAFRDPRTVWMGEALRGQASDSLITLLWGQRPEARVARVSPAGLAIPHSRYFSAPRQAQSADHIPMETDDWLCEAVEPLATVLGPQGEHIVAAVREGIRVFEEDNDSDRAIQYDQARLAIDEWAHASALRAAESALEARHVDVHWWRTCRGDGWGWEILALAARDLIGCSDEWNRDAYDVLTTPWRTAIAPLHPDDRQLSVAP